MRQCHCWAAEGSVCGDALKRGAQPGSESLRGPHLAATPGCQPCAAARHCQGEALQTAGCGAPCAGRSGSAAGGGLLTYASQAPHGDGEALGAWQQVVLEAGQPLGLRHLHADLVLLLCEPRALAVDQELEARGGLSHRAPWSTASRGHTQPQVPRPEFMHNPAVTQPVVAHVQGTSRGSPGGAAGSWRPSGGPVPTCVCRRSFP